MLQRRTGFCVLGHYLVCKEPVVQSVHNIAVSESFWYLSVGEGLERWYIPLGAVASLMWGFCCKAEMEVSCFHIIQQEADLRSCHILVNC